MISFSKTWFLPYIFCNFSTVELQKMYLKNQVFENWSWTSMHSRFSVLFLWIHKLHFSNRIAQSGNWKFVCLQFEMFFYCIAAFSVGKVDGIIHHITVFSMLSWFSLKSGFLSCSNAVKNLLCFNITRLSTTQESNTFFQRSGKGVCVYV